MPKDRPFSQPPFLSHLFPRSVCFQENGRFFAAAPWVFYYVRDRLNDRRKYFQRRRVIFPASARGRHREAFSGPPFPSARRTARRPATLVLLSAKKVG